MTVRLAVLIPCLDEGSTIAKVVGDFRRALPEASVHVCDNGSSDATAARARAAGASVIREPRRGKGNAMRRLFADVQADLYVMVDGDDTYDAADAPRMVALASADGLDAVGGARLGEGRDAYRRGHRLGNAVLARLVEVLFDDSAGDLLSGYRVLSRRFVKTFPAHAEGFELEAELTVHALRGRMPRAELPTRYRARPHGSESKLITWRDGARIGRIVVALVREERPLAFFGAVAVALGTLALVLGMPLVLTFVDTGLVPRFPTAILATGIALAALISGAIGLILDAAARARAETRRLAYLRLPAPADPAVLP